MLLCESWYITVFVLLNANTRKKVNKKKKVIHTVLLAENSVHVFSWKSFNILKQKRISQ